MTQTPILSKEQKPKISWETLPPDFILPDKPVDNQLQPLLAAVLREILEIAGLIKTEMLIATNFGICTKVDDKIAIKAPDWVYVPQTHPTDKIRRSYTPYTEGNLPLIVMEFLSETEGDEYSVNPNYPYGKWYYYEQILQVPIYVIFEPKSGRLEVYRLFNGHYETQSATEQGYYWIAEIGLFLGVWYGTKIDITGYWLRWWDESANLLPLGLELIEQERQKAKELEAIVQRYREQFGDLST